MQATEQLSDIQRRHIGLMQNTLKLWQNVLADVTQEDATTYRDGPDGWTTLEVLCHVRDFDGFFMGRAQMMIEQDNPQLPAYDHEALAIERRYNEQDLQTVLAELAAVRRTFIRFYLKLDEEQWQRTGIHPERGFFTMTDSVMQVGHHDVNHLEQVTRILKQAKG